MAPESSSAAAAKAAGPEVSEELRQLQRGTLTVSEYLDAHAERAVAHLRGQVSMRRLEVIKSVLREQMTTSPGLVELLRRAGVELPPPDAQ
ncbi:MAG TPA: hypothetical protein VJN18_01585 [Polyangiaceae bacterium]|nr:hypothetical protein [Polyangiaceae bacterium]